jgi:hypothetical protein
VVQDWHLVDCVDGDWNVSWHLSWLFILLLHEFYGLFLFVRLLSFCSTMLLLFLIHLLAKSLQYPYFILKCLYRFSTS